MTERQRITAFWLAHLIGIEQSKVHIPRVTSDSKRQAKHLGELQRSMRARATTGLPKPDAGALELRSRRIFTPYVPPRARRLRGNPPRLNKED